MLTVVGMGGWGDQDDSRLCVASGDQQISVVDTEREALLVRLKGHQGSVKTVSGCPQQKGEHVGGRSGRMAEMAEWRVVGL